MGHAFGAFCICCFDNTIVTAQAVASFSYNGVDGIVHRCRAYGNTLASLRNLDKEMHFEKRQLMLLI